MSQIVPYFLHSTSVLSFYIDLVLTLSIGHTEMKTACNHKLCSLRTDIFAYKNTLYSLQASKYIAVYIKYLSPINKGNNIIKHKKQTYMWVLFWKNLRQAKWPTCYELSLTSGGSIPQPPCTLTETAYVPILQLCTRANAVISSEQMQVAVPSNGIHPWDRLQQALSCLGL